MMGTLYAAGTALLAFAVLDGLWLGVIMKTFYRDQLAPVARMADGSLAPIWPTAILVYVLLAGGVAALVVPRAASAGSAALFGALFGLVVYGVYDLTNYSTLAGWPGLVTIVDIAWGTSACALVAVVVWVVAGR
jgi:uncharacterized membrane protein